MHFELGLRLIFGLQLVFWGLNGFGAWIKIPPSGPVIDRFVGACYETRFIMPLVKITEIIAGLFLLIGFMVSATLVMLFPIIFIITGLHLLHNTKPWSVLIPFSVPYFILLLVHSPTWLRLLH